MSQHQPPTCQHTSSPTRNLVVFIDGTSNKPGEKETNVMKLYKQVKSGGSSGSEPKQYALYLPGIGAYDNDNQMDWASRSRREIYRSFELAFALGAEKKVREAYRWLAEKYQGQGKEKEGGEIHLFGFSRGGFQVRALASVIHEVGLVKELNQVESAYNHYLAIDPYKPETRQAATKFKKDFCWDGVRVHFIGVWDTVSSLGLVKRAVHVTESASVTNACHFRHALALDECRVKFMPEYFLEMNAHSKSASPRSFKGDVKEAWFPGSHGDVGGMERPLEHPPSFQLEGHHTDSPPHAGNVSLLWMRQEAADNGLVFQPVEVTWNPEDVDSGRSNSMTFSWKLMEILPVRYQTSFSGTGKHKWRWHLFRPRLVIPNQQIHPSVWSGCSYVPRATLPRGVCIPAVPLGETVFGTSDREALLSLSSLETVLSVLDHKLSRTDVEPRPQLQWSMPDSRGQFDSDDFVLAIIHDVTSNLTATEEGIRDVIALLTTILSSPDHPDFYRTLQTLRFLARHKNLRQRYLNNNQVIEALARAMESTASGPVKLSSSMIMESFYYLIHSDSQQDQHGVSSLRDRAINAMFVQTGTAQSRLSVALEADLPHQLATSLKVVASVSRLRPVESCNALRPRIIKLARERSPVGPAAVEALVAMGGQLTRGLPFSAILGYLDTTLPRLDAEVDVAPPHSNIDGLAAVRLVNESEDTRVHILRELVSTIKSGDVHERNMATLALLKLSQNSDVRRSCLQQDVLEVFLRQLERKRTSLLAAYALGTCLTYSNPDMWKPDDFRRAAPLIVTMFEKGWFDNAVGRVEGSKILRMLMTSRVDLRREIDRRGLLGSLRKKFEAGNRHDIRMSLVFLDTLGEEVVSDVREMVKNSLTHLQNNVKNIQRKGVKTLAALAQTVVGERAIADCVIKIVKMLLVPSLPRSQVFGPAAALYDLSKNENLRLKILASTEFRRLQTQHRSGVYRKKA